MLQKIESFAQPKILLSVLQNPLTTKLPESLISDSDSIPALTKFNSDPVRFRKFSNIILRLFKVWETNSDAKSHFTLASFLALNFGFDLKI